MCDPRKAQTQYNDYRGEAAAYMVDGLTLRDLAQRLGINEGFWPIGFDFYVGETGSSSERPKVNVSVYAVDSKEYGAGIDAVNKSALRKGGPLPVTRFSSKLDAQEFFTFFKHLDVTGFNKSLDADKVEVIQSVECDESRQLR